MSSKLALAISIINLIVKYISSNVSSIPPIGTNIARVNIMEISNFWLIPFQGFAMVVIYSIFETTNNL
jgi:hypothetical protein